jgi:hypothetical protein
MKKRFIIFYVAAFCIVVGLSFATTASSAILFYEDFEDPLDFGKDWALGRCDGSHGLTTEQVRYGSKSYKFSLTHYDSGDYKEGLQPVGFNNGDWHFTIGSEYWTGFSLFLADGYHSPAGGDGGIIHHQYHGHPDNPPTCDPEEPWRTPIQIIKTRQGNWASWIRYDPLQRTPLGGGHTTTFYDYPPFSTGQWVDFVINVKWSYNDDGFLKVWKDGVLVTDYTGGTCYNDDKGPYLWIGIYSHSLDQDQTITIYYDELRIGDSNSSYSEVAPGGSVKPLPPTNVEAK